MSLPRSDDRYELLDELPHVTGGRLYRARDLAFDEIVGVKRLGANCGLDDLNREQLANTIRHLQCLPHPNLSRIYKFDAVEGLIVQEWVQGISMLDLLRRRRELSLSEALGLLARLPATLDFLAREAVPIPRPLLGKLYVELAADVAVDSVAGKPLDQWPAFCLKLNPLSLRDALGAPGVDATSTTVVVDPRQSSDIREGYGPREFALLLYELLGGRIREIDSRRYVPLGALGEAGNAVLRRELLAMPHADCEALWRDLLQSQAGTLRPARTPEAVPTKPGEYKIPTDFLASVPPGLAVALEASKPEVLSIHLTGRPRFLIGRSSAMADFVARVLPENDTNNARTNRLSRIHAFADIEDGHIAVRDGNGTGPSLNGSFLDGQALTPTSVTILPHRARLLLGEEYALDLIPLDLIEPPLWKIANLDAWNGPAEKPPLAPYAAVVCEAAEGYGLSRQSVWIFSEAGFGLDTAGRIVWDTRGRGGSPAAFHFHRGCFWLRNHSLAQPIFIGKDTALGRGEIVPLVPGQTIRLGAHDFTIHIE